LWWFGVKDFSFGEDGLGKRKVEDVMGGGEWVVEVERRGMPTVD